MEKWLPVLAQRKRVEKSCAVSSSMRYLASSHRSGLSLPLRQPHRRYRTPSGGGVPKCGSALELGCGSGASSVFLAQEGFRVTSVDIAPEALERCRRRAEAAGVAVEWVEADVFALPGGLPEQAGGASSTFDFIFDLQCFHVLRGNKLHCACCRRRCRRCRRSQALVW